MTLKPTPTNEIELLYLLEKEAQELARNNFAAFVQYTMPEYEMNWHHKFLCDKLELFVAKKIRRLMVFMPPRRGKLIADTTPVLTLHGWKTHGELRIGDYVFGIDGQPKKVLAISPKDSADIEIAFSNGESILCHEAHEWVVFDRTVGKDRIVEAREFLKTTKFNRPKQLKSKGRHLYQLPRISALDTPPIFLPLDPYFLGLWLGDGSTGKVCITHHKDDTQPITYLKGGGFEVSSICTHNDTGVLTTYFVPTKIKKALISLGIFKQKDLPEIYLRASKSQRLSLLAGLIDSDGHVDKAGRVIFSNTNERIILSVRELLLTLGIRPYLSRREPKTSSSGVVGRKVVYELGFQPIEPIPLKLPRKRDRISRFVSGLPVRIEGVRRVAPEIGRCIEVEGGIYLVGKTLLPTHNSQLVSRHLPAYILGKNPNTEIIASSYNIGLATRMNRDVQRIIDSPEYKKVFPETKLFGKNIKTLAGTPLRNSEIFEICDAKGVYRASGVGTGITGMGFHCFTGGTLVLTKSGCAPIKDIKIGDLVWSYNHETRQPELKRVKAVFNRIVSETVTVQTTKGTSVVCTPEHNFFIKGHGYKEAKDCELGETIEARLPESSNALFRPRLPLLWERVSAQAIRVVKVFTSRAQRILLQQPMLEKTSQLQEHKVLREVQKNEGFKKYAKVLRGLSFGTCPPRNKKIKSLWETISSYSAFDFMSRQIYLRPMFEAGEINSPHRRKPRKQFTRKSNNFMQGLPYGKPQIGSGKISRVYKNRNNPVQVFDITVEGNHNYFVEGILVHNCGIIDDPVKDMAQALSPTYRQNVWDWYCSTFLTRGMGQDSILITLTRWHEDDLAGRLLEKMKTDPDSDQWEIICFPEIKEDNQNPDDPREIGEVLWPSRYDLAKVKQTRASAGQIVWNSLYQQKPSMGEGGILKKAWWKFWTTLPPRLDDKIITCDPTMSGGEDKDFCVYQCWGRKGPDKFLIDQMRGQWDYPTSRKKLREFLSLHGKGVSVIKVENKANGPALIAELKSEFPGIVPFNPQGSKEARALSHANSASAQLEAGNIFLPDPVVAPWVADFIQEAAEFPKGRNDDQVDCYVMAILHWLESGFDLFGASGTFDEDVPETLIDSIIDAEW